MNECSAIMATISMFISFFAFLVAFATFVLELYRRKESVKLHIYSYRVQKDYDNGGKEKLYLDMAVCNNSDLPATIVDISFQFGESAVISCGANTYPKTSIIMYGQSLPITSFPVIIPGHGAAKIQVAFMDSPTINNGSLDEYEYCTITMTSGKTSIVSNIDLRTAENLSHSK